MAEIKIMASKASSYGKFATMDFEKMHRWINQGLCISPVKTVWLGCPFCGQDGSLHELHSYQSISKHLRQGLLHHPILLPIAHPDEDKKILDKLICDDNSHR